MKNINFQLATPIDTNKVIDFYKTVCADPNNKARWRYGLYPNDEDLINDIKNNELYILLEEDKIVAAGVIRMQEDDLYKDINWNRNNPAVIHILAVLPDKWHHGYGKILLNHLIDVARNNNKDSIHLDIVYDNDAARKLYESVGFKFIEDQELFYPDTGLLLSSLFEYII